MAEMIVHDRKDFQKKKRKKLTKYQEGKLRKKLWKDQNGLCARCGLPLRKGDTIFNTAHLRHIKSKGSGGHDTEENRELVHGFECHLESDHSPQFGKSHFAVCSGCGDKSFNLIRQTCLKCGESDIYESEGVPNGFK